MREVGDLAAEEPVEDGPLLLVRDDGARQRQPELARAVERARDDRHVGVDGVERAGGLGLLGQGLGVAAGDGGSCGWGLGTGDWGPGKGACRSLAAGPQSLILRQVGDKLIDEPALGLGVDLAAQDLLGRADRQRGDL